MLIKKIIARVKMDYKEWKNHLDTMYRLKRDKKNTNRAIARAKIKNSMDGKTYLIIRNADGNPEEFPSSNISVLRQRGLLPKEYTYEKALEFAAAIVTKNHVTRNQYTAKSVDKTSSDE